MSYTVHQAKTNLSRLIKEAEGGKEVIITRGKTHPSDQPRPRSPDRRRAERTGTALGVKRAKEKGGSHYGSPPSLNLKSSIAHSKGISTASIHFISSIKS